MATLDPVAVTVWQLDHRLMAADVAKLMNVVASVSYRVAVAAGLADSASTCRQRV